MIQLIIFDLDGTLVDSAGDIVAAFHELTDRRGLTRLPDEHVRNAIGEGLRALMTKCLPRELADPRLAREIDREFYELYERRVLDTTRPYPGVIEQLQRLSQNHRIAIVTNKHEALAHQSIAFPGLKELPWVKVVGADTYSERKPHPLPLQEVMRIAGVQPQQTLMVGDGIPDMKAAQAARVHSVACTYGYARTELLLEHEPSLLLSAFTEFDRILDQAKGLAPRI